MTTFLQAGDKAINIDSIMCIYVRRAKYISEDIGNDGGLAEKDKFTVSAVLDPGATGGDCFEHSLSEPMSEPEAEAFLRKFLCSLSANPETKVYSIALDGSFKDISPARHPKKRLAKKRPA